MSKQVGKGGESFKAKEMAGAKVRQHGCERTEGWGS